MDENEFVATTMLPDTDIEYDDAVQLKEQKIWPHKKKNWFGYFSSFHWKTVNIPFSEFFGPEALDYEECVLFTPVKKYGSKKNGNSTMSYLIYRNNEILNRNKELADEFIYRYYVLKKRIDEFSKYDSVAFINDLIAILVSENMIAEIKKYVLENYNEAIKPTNVKKKIIEVYTFQDEHYKILYEISAQMRLALPLLTHYIYRFPETKADEFIVRFVEILFQLYQGPAYNILMKLRYFIRQQIGQTVYANKAIWHDVEIFGMFPESKTSEILNQIIANSFPKFDFDENIIAYISSITRQNIKWMLGGEHPWNVHALSDVDSYDGGDDDSSSSETDVFDSFQRRDELLLVIRRSHFIKDAINKIASNMNIIITPEEFAFYKENSDIHMMQMFGVYQFFAPWFSGAENIYATRIDDHINLVAILARHLDSLGIDTFSQILTGKKKAHIHQRSNMMFDKTIYNDPRYLNLMAKKYINASETITRKDLIRGTIKTAINHKFEYSHFGCPHNGVIIEKDEDDIRDNVLRFYEIIR